MIATRTTKTNKITLTLTIIIVGLLLLRFVISLNQGDETSDRIPYSYTEKDTLSFLLKNSDLVAVVFIEGGNDVGQNSFQKIWDPVDATLISTVWQKENMPTPPEKFKIEPTPFFQDKGVLASQLFLRNGENLAFLMETKERHYKPTTGSSVFDVYNQGNVLPIWKERSIGDEMSPGFPLEQIKKEIIEHSKAP